MTEDAGPLGQIDMAATTLYAADLDAAVTWYADKLGLTPMSVSKDGHPFAVFRIGGTLVVLEPIEAALEPAPPGAESTTVNLVVKRDANDIRTELIANGYVAQGH